MTRQGEMIARQVLTVLGELRDAFLSVFVLACALAGAFTAAGYIWDARWCFVVSLILDGISISFGGLYFMMRKALK